MKIPFVPPFPSSCKRKWICKRGGCASSANTLPPPLPRRIVLVKIDLGDDANANFSFPPRIVLVSSVIEGTYVLRINLTLDPLMKEDRNDLCVCKNTHILT